MQFGRSSERLDREIEQLEFASRSWRTRSPDRNQPERRRRDRAHRASRALPEHLPRERVVHEPACNCPECGAEMRKIGEDVSEVLDYVPARFRVIRHVRPKLACPECERIVQVQAPSRPIERGLPVRGCSPTSWSPSTPTTCRCTARRRSTPARAWNWSARRWPSGSGCFRLLEPLIEALARYVFAAGKLHADDTPVPVLDPGRGKTKTGRLWTYVRDDRPARERGAPAVLFRYSPDRRGERPRDT